MDTWGWLDQIGNRKHLSLSPLVLPCSPAESSAWSRQFLLHTHSCSSAHLRLGLPLCHCFLLLHTFICPLPLFYNQLTKGCWQVQVSRLPYFPATITTPTLYFIIAHPLYHSCCQNIILAILQKENWTAQQLPELQNKGLFIIGPSVYYRTFSAPTPCPPSLCKKNLDTFGKRSNFKFIICLCIYTFSYAKAICSNKFQGSRAKCLTFGFSLLFTDLLPHWELSLSTENKKHSEKMNTQKDYWKKSK